MSPNPPPGFRRVTADFDAGTYRAIRTFAAAEEISVVSVLRALTEAWANDEGLKKRVLPRARELDAEAKKRRRGSEV